MKVAAGLSSSSVFLGVARNNSYLQHSKKPEYICLYIFHYYTFATLRSLFLPSSSAASCVKIDRRTHIHSTRDNMRGMLRAFTCNISLDSFQYLRVFYSGQPVMSGLISSINKLILQLLSKC